MLVLVFLSHMSREDEPEPVVKFTVAMGFFLALLAGMVPLFDDRQPQWGSAGQHYWLVAIFVLQTLLPMIALWWLAKKLEKHPQTELPPT